MSSKLGFPETAVGLAGRIMRRHLCSPVTHRPSTGPLGTAFLKWLHYSLVYLHEG